MNGQMNTASQQLENAFEIFNQYSEKLAGSYGDLESHVTRLTKELAEARSERLFSPSTRWRRQRDSAALPEHPAEQ